MTDSKTVVAKTKVDSNCARTLPSMPMASADNFRSTYNASQKLASIGKDKNDFAKFKQNCIVEHVKFGRGVITAVEGSGDDAS